VKYDRKNKVKIRRSCYRFVSPFLKAQYFLREEKGSREQCRISNMSRKGMGLKFHTDETINIGSSIHLEMYVSRKSEPIKVKGILKWIEKEGNDFIGCIELTEELDDAMWEELFSLPLDIQNDNDDS
jgi:hypothetical protein